MTVQSANRSLYDVQATIRSLYSAYFELLGHWKSAAELLVAVVVEECVCVSLAVLVLDLDERVPAMCLSDFFRRVSLC